ncbi:MAG: tetratricopeptide repeat protein [Phycisphaerae bacterium]
MRTNSKRLVWYTLLAGMLLACCGCPPNGPENVIVAKDVNRDTAAAAAHNEVAIELLGRGDLAGADKEITAALAADPLFGPAHNSLGILYYKQKNYYDAAREFDRAAAIMPRKAEPRYNLGMVREDTGDFAKAAKAYEEALALDPASVEVTANLARVYVRMNRNDDRTRELLGEVVTRDPRPQWSNWARERLALMGAPKPPTTEPAPTP